MLSELRKLIAELIKQEVEESSGTGNVAGYSTPNAFSDDEKDEDELNLSDGMEVVKESYWTYRNDESLTTKQKLAKSMIEIRTKIVEIEKIVKYNVKLKNEMHFESDQYMIRTKGALNKISEKLTRLSSKIKDLV